MRYCNTLAEYEQAKTDGIINDDVLVIVLDEKVAKFKGQTFDWSEGNSLSEEIDGLKDSKQDVIEDLDTIRSGAALGATALQNVKTINGNSIEGDGDVSVGSITSVDTGDALDDVDVRYATEQYVDNAIANVDVDTSNLATKEELESLTNEMIANEEVTAAALNELNERVNEISENVSGSTVTKEEFKDAIDTLQKEVIDNEEVVAAALNDLNTRLNEILTRLNNAGI